ncbi:hypothetical protein ACF0H5_023646 [Mactra antiquata]
MAPSMEAIAQSLVHLSQEKNPATREQLLRTGLNEMVKWFTLAAQIILQKKVQLPKQTLNFMEKHRHELEQLQDDNIDLDTKRQLILKPGGSGFLGGVMIRSLLRWNGKKTIRKFGPKKTTKKTAKKTAKKTSKKRKAYVAHKTPVPSPQSLHPSERSSRHSSTPSTPRQSSRHSSTPRRSSRHSTLSTPRSSRSSPFSGVVIHSTPRRSSRHSTPIHSTPRSSRSSPFSGVDIHSTPRRSSRHSTPIHSTPRSSRSSPFSGVNFTPIHSTPNSSRSSSRSSSRRSLTDSSSKSSSRSSSHISTRPYSFTGSSTPRTPKSTSSLSPPARFSPLHIDSDMVKQELMRQGLRRMEPTSATPVDKMQDLVRRGVRRLLSQPRTGDASMNDTLNALEWLYK